MRAATLVLAVMLALSCAGLAEGQTGSIRDGVPILMAPISVLDVEIVERVVGVAYNDNDDFFWMSQIVYVPYDPTDDPFFLEHDLDGAPQASYPQDAVYQGIGHNDLAYYDGGMWASECFWIKKFDLAGGFDYTYFCAPWPEFNELRPCRAVAKFPMEVSEVSHWVVGGEDSHVYSGDWDGVSGSTPAWTPITPAPLPSVRGIAYDPTKDCLWVADDVHNTLYQVNLDGGPLLGQIPNWGALYGSPRGLCVADTPTHGLVLAATFVNERAPSRFVLFDLDTIVPVEQTSWTSIKALYR